MTVTVYTAPSCMACKQTMRHMDKRGIRLHPGATGLRR